MRSISIKDCIIITADICFPEEEHMMGPLENISPVICVSGYGNAPGKHISLG